MGKNLPEPYIKDNSLVWLCPQCYRVVGRCLKKRCRCQSAYISTCYSLLPMVQMLIERGYSVRSAAIEYRDACVYFTEDYPEELFERMPKGWKLRKYKKQVGWSRSGKRKRWKTEAVLRYKWSEDYIDEIDLCVGVDYSTDQALRDLEIWLTGIEPGMSKLMLKFYGFSADKTKEEEFYGKF